MRNDTLLNRLLTRVQELESKLEKLNEDSSLALETVAVQVRTFAQLPPAGVKGRMFYVTDGRKGGETAGNGTGVLALDDENGGSPTWVRSDDPTQVVQV